MGKTYRYEGDGPVTIAVPGSASTVTLESGDTVEAEDDAQAEAFEANPDLTAGSKRESSKDEKSGRRG